MGVRQAFARCPFILPPSVVAGDRFDRGPCSHPGSACIGLRLGRARINRQHRTRPTRAPHPAGPPLSNPAHLPYTQVRRPLGPLGTTGVRAVQRVAQPVQGPQGHRINPARDPLWGGDDGCRTMRKPLRFSQQKLGLTPLNRVELSSYRWP